MVVSPGAADDTRKVDEYRLKAAFIYNFSRFVSWPENLFKSQNDPLTIGIMGENPFSKKLENIIAAEKNTQRPIIYLDNVSLSQIHNCHILYISPSEKLRLPAIVKQLNGQAILTVGDYPGFCQAGGIINIEKENNRLKLVINNQKALAVNLKISAKLLRIANMIEN